MADCLLLAASVNGAEDLDAEPILQLLPEPDRSSIRRNRRSIDRIRRILARLLLAHGLCRLEGWSLRHGLGALCREPQGRPYLAGSDRPVSLSHAGDWAVCAIGRRGQPCIGVDVEEIRALDVEEFRLIFNPQEQLAIRSHGNPASELIRCWTVKESVLKAQGTGLLADPLRIHVTGPEQYGQPWHWQHADLQPGYWLTVASPHHLDAIDLTRMNSRAAMEDLLAELKVGERVPCESAADQAASSLRDTDCPGRENARRT